MAKLRRVPGLVAIWDDGSATGVSCVEQGADLEALLGRTPPIDPVFDVEEGSDAQARAIPNWATWTEAEALAWFTVNITDTLDAVPDVDGLTATQYRTNAQAIDAQWQDVITAQAAAIRGLTRMALALRNKLWPNLEGSE